MLGVTGLRMHFYFEAQTGIIRDELPKAPSNYHQVRLEWRHRAKVEAEVAKAVPGCGGLVYSDGFLKWCRDNDKTGRGF